MRHLARGSVPVIAPEQKTDRLDCSYNNQKRPQRLPVKKNYFHRPDNCQSAVPLLNNPATARPVACFFS